MNSVNVKLNP
ncbi:Protein of unknown function [Bacillus cereus]|nr:Protein of unknown function [Bacillus cereus]